MSGKQCITLLRHFQASRNLNKFLTFASATPRPAQLWRTYSSGSKSATQENTADASQQGNESAASPVDLAAFEKLQADLEISNKKYDELMDKYKRSLADGENMRIRLEKRAEDAKVFGIQSFGKDLLEVADNLHNATAAVPKDELQKNSQLKNLYDGLMMTQASLLQIFKRHGLEPLNPLNTKFDPNFHEALFMKVDATVEPNTVIEVTKVGYKLRERCIRPALVGVSKTS